VYKLPEYPSITTEEEAISVPLQTLCLAIFDSILVHMMNQIAPKTWQPLRNDMCAKLNTKKNARTVEILETSYSDSDVIFLQEVAGSFPTVIKSSPLSGFYNLYQPSNLDADRDQNSFILLRKERFTGVVEVTKSVMNSFSNSSKKVPVENGDLLVVLATDVVSNSKYIFASFHGDTNGLATIPVVQAVRDFATFAQPDRSLLFGLDANTYTTPEDDQQGVVEFGKFFTSLKLNSCYGQSPNPKNFTTFHARTHLQPQLNKVVYLLLRFSNKRRRVVVVICCSVSLLWFVFLWRFISQFFLSLCRASSARFCYHVWLCDNFDAGFFNCDLCFSCLHDDLLT
jgi:hypothetical protein